MDRKKIIEFINNRINRTDFFLVDVHLKPGNIIKVYIDKPDGITIDECVELSRDFNATFDRDVEDYDLQVSSPGLDMPLKVKGQFEKNLGKEVQVIQDDGKKLKGILEGYNEKELKLSVTTKEKAEGSKKKKTVTRETMININNIKAVKAIISFK